MGPIRSPGGLFMGCLQSLKSYGACKLIMHTLKLYGPCTERQNSNGAARGPCGPHQWTFDFCSKQPVNSPYGARECDVMPQSHHTPGPRMGCSQAVLNKNGTSTHGARTGPVRRHRNVASPYGARRIGVISLRAPYRFRDHTQPVNSPCGSRKGPVRAPYGHIRRKFWLCRFPYVSIRVPCGSPTGPVGFEKHWIFPCGARTTPVRGLCARGLCEVPRIIRSKCKSTAASSRTGPVA